MKTIKDIQNDIKELEKILINTNGEERKKIQKKINNKKYYIKNKEELKEKAKERREKNKEQLNKVAKEWIKNNKEAFNEYKRERNKKKLTKEAQKQINEFCEFFEDWEFKDLDQALYTFIEDLQQDSNLHDVKGTFIEVRTYNVLNLAFKERYNTKSDKVTQTIKVHCLEYKRECFETSEIVKIIKDNHNKSELIKSFKKVLKSC